MADFPQSGFLAALSAADEAELRPSLKLVELKPRTVIQEQGDIIKHVYFPVVGLVSLLATMRDGRASECAVVGSCGGTGLGAAMGKQRATSRAIMQMHGSAFRVTTAKLNTVARENHSLTTRLFVHQESPLAQVQQTAACNSLHSAEQRLAP
jgi:CRP-like cAMP-binding protein